MSTPEICYATREQVKAVLDSKQTARADAQIDRAIARASRTAEGYLHRRFYPELTTHYFDWPQGPGNRSWRIWLDERELISVASAVAGSTTLDVNNLFLEPSAYGPPYDRIETNRGASDVFQTGTTEQRAVGITGVYGYQLNEHQQGTLNGSITSGATTLKVAESVVTSIGVGSLLRIDDERLVVTGRTYAASGATITADLDSKAATNAVAVSSTASFTIGETILVDGETMYVISIAGSNLIVKRSWDGSTLATHTSGATVYAPRTLSVTRGVLGTTAASHSDGAAAYLFDFPSDLQTYVIAEAVFTLLQEQAGYPDKSTGAALETARCAAQTSLGRANMARTRTV